MARQIYKVDAQIVDANGAFHVLDGYPKTFDSNNYSGDVEKAQRRAEGEFSETWGAMCKRDDRMIQTVTLSTVEGFQIDQKCSGGFPVESEEEVEENEAEG